jgi:hypothetical protein
MLKMTSYRHAARAALVCSSVLAFVACSTATYKKDGRASGAAPTPAAESASGDSTLQDCPKLRLTGGHGKHGGGKHGGGKHGGGKHGGGKDPYVPGHDDGGDGKDPYVPGHDHGGWGKHGGGHGKHGGGKDPYVPGYDGGKDPYVPGHDDGGDSYEPGKDDGDIVVVPTDPTNPCTGDEPATEEPGKEEEEPGSGEEPSPEVPPTQDLGEEPELEPGKEPCDSCGSYEPGQSPKQGPTCGKHGKHCEEGPGQYKGDEPKSGF